MLQNAYFDYFLAKIGADTAENEQHFAEILPIGRRVADRTQACSAAVLTLRSSALSVLRRAFLMSLDTSRSLLYM